MGEPFSTDQRNLYARGETPAVGDVVESDGSQMLVLAIEGPIPESVGGNVLRGVPSDLPPPWGKGRGWMMDAGTRNTWLPWCCFLVRRDALGELELPEGTT